MISEQAWPQNSVCLYKCENKAAEEDTCREI